MKNKGLRNEITKRKFKTRLKTLGLKQYSPTDFICFKSQAVPCSCYLCSHQKYKRSIKHKSKNIDL